MSADVTQELVRLFNDEQSTLDQLKQALEDESSALLKHDIKAIEHSAQQKHALLGQFQQQVQSRLQYLSSQQYSPSEQGLSDFINDLSGQETQTLSQQWDAIRQDFKALMTQNERNGVIIQHSRHRNRQLLNILHGNKNEPNLYNESGSTKQGHLGHRLGEA